MHQVHVCVHVSDFAARHTLASSSLFHSACCIAASAPLGWWKIVSSLKRLIFCHFLPSRAATGDGAHHFTIAICKIKRLRVTPHLLGAEIAPGDDMRRSSRKWFKPLLQIIHTHTLKYRLPARLWILSVLRYTPSLSPWFNDSYKIILFDIRTPLLWCTLHLERALA